MAQVILLSQFPLPYSHIGSWTTMYKNYLSGPNQVDVIVCEKPEYFFENIQYELIGPESPLNRLRHKITKKRFCEYTDALAKLIKPNEKYIIQIVDNLGMAKAVQQFLDESGLRKQCYLQYFYHGFPPFGNASANLRFYEKADEMITLTHRSYLAFKNETHVLPPRFSVLHNGIDTDKFHPIDANDKIKLREQLGFTAKKIFLWCSHDRPKKGLDLVLDAWKRVYNNNDMLLLVIGAPNRNPQPGVQFMPAIPNDQLPQYYQLSDAFVFSTLCHEGFGMSLIEAMHCGCYCMASDMGGVPEVLQDGRLGKLIQNPHFISEWVAAIEDFLQHKNQQYPAPGELYSANQWRSGMESIITQAKHNLEN